MSCCATITAMNQLCLNKLACGSCGWSHIPYHKQLLQKQADIQSSFDRHSLELTAPAVLPSPTTEHYRNRMDFVIDFEGRVGLREKGKWWRVIDNHHCFLADTFIERVFNVVRSWVGQCGLSFFDRKSHIGLLRYAVVRSTTTGETMLTIVTSAPLDPQEEELVLQALEVLSASAQVSTVIWSINHTVSDVSFGDELRVIAGSGTIMENIGGIRYTITPNAFFQTNSLAAGLLQATVVDWATQHVSDTVLDLYCGSGFFTIPIARGVKSGVVGVELVAEAIDDARTNADLNDVQVQFIAESTEHSNWADLQPDLLILDPPRSGMHDTVLQQVLQVLPRRIVYVSCNYKQFSREMVLLRSMYSVEHQMAIDMFPHTPHVELITALTRK